MRVQDCSLQQKQTAAGRPAVCTRKGTLSCVSAHASPRLQQKQTAAGTTSHGAVAQRSTACPSLHLRPLMPGTSSVAKGGNDEGPDIMEKRSFKPGTTADEIITILLDDRELLPPPNVKAFKG